MIDFRKRKVKDEQSRERLPDHHLFQSVTDVSRNSPRPERPGDIPPLDLARELTGVSNAGMKNIGAKTIRKNPEEGHHRNMNALKDPEGKIPKFAIFVQQFFRGVQISVETFTALIAT